MHATLNLTFVSPWDNTDVVLTFPNSWLPLVECMGLEVGEPYEF